MRRRLGTIGSTVGACVSGLRATLRLTDCGKGRADTRASYLSGGVPHLLVDGRPRRLRDAMSAVGAGTPCIDALDTFEIPSLERMREKRLISVVFRPVRASKRFVRAIHVHSVRYEVHDETITLVIGHDFKVAPDPGAIAHMF